MKRYLTGILVGARTQAAQGSKALSRHWQALAEIQLKSDHVNRPFPMHIYLNILGLNPPPFVSGIDCG